jgi:murein DD-endopeptidase MepM/ murein hydrolase activator NlpD
MRANHVLLSFLISLFTAASVPACADAYQAALLPKSISPGDAFTLKVTGILPPDPPSASLKGKPLYFTPCGEGCLIAVGAVDVEAKPGVSKVLITDGKKKRHVPLVVKQPRFPRQSITLPADKVFLSPDDLVRADKEAVRLQSLWKTVTAPVWEGSFILPLNNNTSTVFGTKRIINRKKISIHKGTDIQGREGEKVQASNRGRVVLAEELFFGGNTVILDHGQGIYTLYMHLSGFAVRPEDMVSKGDVIGFVGSSGRSSGPHLHFGVKVQDTSVNPLSFTKLKL